MNLPTWPGWHLIGAFPHQQPDDVGAWLLHDGRDALLLEVPPGLGVWHVRRALRLLAVNLRYVTASHAHEDHLDQAVWEALRRNWPRAQFLDPRELHDDNAIALGEETAWIVRAPKHSLSDVVTIFRGVAMTGDIELEMEESVNAEVPPYTKRRSMTWLAGFQQRHGYHVHSIVSAHLNDVRCGVNWPALFPVAAAAAG